MPVQVTWNLESARLSGEDIFPWI